jgi:hypothetical protein
MVSVEVKHDPAAYLLVAMQTPLDLPVMTENRK